MTTQTRVVHVRRDAYDVYIGRSMPRFPDLKATGWGNPFKPAPDMDAITNYRAWVLNQPHLLVRLPELRGKRLGCWCAPAGGLDGDLYGHFCHGEVLAALADMPQAMLDDMVTKAQQEQRRPAIKAISLWQPWASLMAAGYKRVETRSWVPRGLKHGQLVAIHAAKRWTDEVRELCEYDSDFNGMLRLAEKRGLWDFDKPPLGCIVAIARFDQAIPTYQFFKARGDTPIYRLSEDEANFGNYGPNRFGWIFSEVRPLEPIPLRGMQGLFDWTPPAELHYLEPRNVAKAMVTP